MSEDFKPITTQEEFDSAIKERISRLTEKHNKEISEITSKYADYEDLKKGALSYNETLAQKDKFIEEQKALMSGYEAQISDRDSKIASYELRSVKQQIAIEAGLPYAMAERLNGTTEEEIRKDAEELSAYIVKNQRTAPLSSESATGKDADGVSAIFKAMNPNLKI